MLWLLNVCGAPHSLLIRLSKPEADLSRSSPKTLRLLLMLSAYYLGMPQRGNQRHPSNDVAEQGGKEELRDISRP